MAEQNADTLARPLHALTYDELRFPTNLIREEDAAGVTLAFPPFKTGQRPFWTAEKRRILKKYLICLSIWFFLTLVAAFIPALAAGSSAALRVSDWFVAVWVSKAVGLAILMLAGWELQSQEGSEAKAAAHFTRIEARDGRMRVETTGRSGATYEWPAGAIRGVQVRFSELESDARGADLREPDVKRVGPHLYVSLKDRTSRNFLEGRSMAELEWTAARLGKALGVKVFHKPNLMRDVLHALGRLVNW